MIKWIFYFNTKQKPNYAGDKGCFHCLCKKKEKIRKENNCYDWFYFKYTLKPDESTTEVKNISNAETLFYYKMYQEVLSTWAICIGY